MSDLDQGNLQKFLELFTVGKELTEELVRENQRLKERLHLLEEGGNGRSGELGELKRRLDELDSENREFQRRYHEIEQQNREFAMRCSEVEEQNNNLASLYVASYQLHSTLDFREVLQIVEEILVNLVGAESFSVLLLDEQDRSLRTIIAEGTAVLPGLRDLTVLEGDSVLWRVISTGGSHFDTDRLGSAPSLDRPIAAVPLKIGEQVIGAIAVFSLFQQKDVFTAIDYELFSLLAAHAAAAIFSSRLYSQSERKLSTIQSFLDLLTT